LIKNKLTINTNKLSQLSNAIYVAELCIIYLHLDAMSSSTHTSQLIPTNCKI